MKVIEIKDTCIIIQKSFIKKLCKSLGLAVLAAFLTLVMIEQGYALDYNIYNINLPGTGMNIFLVVVSDLTLLCVGSIIKYFAKPKKWQINVLYLILSVLWGYHYFSLHRSAMIPTSWIYEWGLTQNLILMYSVHIALTIVIFTTTILIEHLCGKTKIKPAVIPAETDKPI